MATAIIELNDSAIQCQHGATAVSAPGYALLTRQGVITGEPALRKAWLLPQQTHNQYWYQLNLSPLKTNNRQARHHADLAYAQLLAIYEQAGKPEQVIFAVPGSASNDQLAILLGLVNATPFTAVGVIDAAVAATSLIDCAGAISHLDIQLHTSVITRIHSGTRISRLDTSQYPEIALKGFYDAWAQFIADQFIREYRYDPLHTAAGEQQLRDLLPQWLAQIRVQPELTIELVAQQGNFRLNLLRKELVAATRQRWQRLAEAVSKDQGSATVLLSHRIAALPGVEEFFDDAYTLDANAAIAACLAHAEHIAAGREKLAFITALPATGKKSDAAVPATINTTAAAAKASHLLYNDRAYAIGNNLCIGFDRGVLLFGGPRLANVPARINLTRDGAKLAVTDITNAAELSSDGDIDNLHRGDTLVFNGQTMRLIEVP